MIIAVHQPGRPVGRAMAVQERGQRVHARQRLAGVPGQLPVTVPFGQPAGHLPAQEPLRMPQVAEPGGHVVDPPDAGQLGGGGLHQVPSPARGLGAGRQPHHRVDPVNRAHDQERNAEHRIVGARRGPPRVRHVGAGQRLQHPSLAQDRLPRPWPRMPGRAAQHVRHAAPAEADQQVLRAPRERNQALDRAAREPLPVQPAR